MLIAENLQINEPKVTEDGIPPAPVMPNDDGLTCAGTAGDAHPVPSFEIHFRKSQHRLQHATTLRLRRSGCSKLTVWFGSIVAWAWCHRLSRQLPKISGLFVSLSDFEPSEIDHRRRQSVRRKDAGRQPAIGRQAGAYVSL